ncbi:hypothetical protein PSECIP111854_01034 [Pseudoalteromonas sp. CIP111854]|uniref:Lipoprotein n=1 Tax=Pseudoalteromonas holothuriae TaxID=2963714 RepID=A0A9W4QTP8_9GAMM|nr:hypothetical protein [Pseudoalteromonas sp. CIP111854]CAH9052748.1 hypothetical protein PSECIP111854_01034 [Pseudoalteromonas sp. CIP111854]
MKTLLLCSTVVAFLSGCIFVPKEVTYFDEQCQTFSKKAVLDTQNAMQLQECDSRTCGFMLASAGLVSAASVVVSGSVVVMKNVVYWHENQRDCYITKPDDEPVQVKATASDISDIERH